MTGRLRIEYVPTASLRPHERNARTHSAEQIAQIVGSIKAFGWTNPVLIDEGETIIAGHGRLVAAQELGLADVPVIRMTGLSDQQRAALAIADNKIALNAGWDGKLLAAELKSLGDLQGIVGFSADELLRLFGGHRGLTDPDAVPAPPAVPVTQIGDLWTLGHHRLLCGDATKADHVAKALDGAQPHLMVTDPPYGVDYDPDWRNRADRANGKPFGARAVGLVVNDDHSDWSAAWKLFPGDVVYAWSPPGDLLVRHHDALIAAGFEVRMQIIWAKQQFVIGRGHYHVQHEPCWYAVRKGKTAHWQGDRTQSTLWQIDKPMKSETGHSTQKPVECMRRPIENNSAAREAIYDPFVGSGTTIIAAEMTERTCYAIEIDPAYCDVAVNRWEQFTGQKAQRRSAEAHAA